MDEIKYNISLDCRREEPQAVVWVKSGEVRARKLVIALKDGRAEFAVPKSAIVVFRAQKPSGSVIYNACTVTDDGRVEYALSAQTVAENGVIPAEIEVISLNGKVLFSPKLTIVVNDKLGIDGQVESSDEYGALEEALLAAKKLRGGLRINISNNANGQPIADKTFDEIEAAVEAGAFVFAVDGWSVYLPTFGIAKADETQNVMRFHKIWPDTNHNLVHEARLTIASYDLAASGTNVDFESEDLYVTPLIVTVTKTEENELTSSENYLDILEAINAGREVVVVGDYTSLRYRLAERYTSDTNEDKSFFKFESVLVRDETFMYLMILDFYGDGSIVSTTIDLSASGGNLSNYYTKTETAALIESALGNVASLINAL